VLFYLIGVLESFAPERDWNQLRAVHSRVKRKAGRESKKRPRIVCAQDLFDLGMELMRNATKVGLEDCIDVDLFLDGLLVTLLISVYLRIGNFAALELERDLERGPSQWRLRVAGELTKTGQADHSTLPVTLTSWLDVYVDVIRPLSLVRHRIADGPVARFWIGPDGKPLSGHLIRKRIKLRTKEAFGFPICPHTFRKIAATTFVLERPEYALHGPALLGHRSEDTIQRHYFVAQQQLAIRTYHCLRDSRLAKEAGRVGAKGIDTRDRRIRAMVACAPPVGRH